MIPPKDLSTRNIIIVIITIFLIIVGIETCKQGIKDHGVKLTIKPLEKVLVINHHVEDSLKRAFTVLRLKNDSLAIEVVNSKNKSNSLQTTYLEKEKQFLALLNNHHINKQVRDSLGLIICDSLYQDCKLANFGFQETIHVEDNQISVLEQSVQNRVADIVKLSSDSVTLVKERNQYKKAYRKERNLGYLAKVERDALAVGVAVLGFLRVIHK